MATVDLSTELLYVLHSDYVDDNNPSVEEAIRFLIKFHREQTELE